MPDEQLTFSIIIPAHNESAYIEGTLAHIKDLNYPKDRFEVVLVENGSTDDTLAKAKKFEGGNITILSSEKKGVSAAKNMCIQNMHLSSAWTIVLDADTELGPNFLSDLSAFLLSNAGKKYTIGTTEVLPIPDRAVARAWFRFYDFGHRLSKASYSIQVVRSDILRQFRFDENMTMGEDLELIEFALREGKFFFFPTKEVHTSTRRFDKEGYWKIFFSWTFVAMLPPSLKRKFTYKVVR